MYSVELLIANILKTRTYTTLPVSEGGGSPGTDGVPGHEHRVLVVGDVLGDVLEEERSRTQVVHATGEETLRLFGMQINGEEVIEASLYTHVSDQLQ